MGYASEDLQQKYAAQQRGELTRVELPDGSGGVAWVKTGASTHTLDDGRILRIDWLESMPPQPGRVSVEGPVVDRALLAVSFIQDAAREVHCLEELSPRDRNAIIGQLRNVAGQIVGLRLVPEFPPVPFQR